MASSPKAVAPGGGGRMEKLNPGVIVDQINKELLRQREFGKVWGPLVSESYPKTFEEQIDKKKAELEKIKNENGTIGTNPFTTTTRAEYANTKSLEGGIGKAYKVLRAGV